ncbi:MAG TPA: histidine kinase [Segetibacter sp.]
MFSHPGDYIHLVSFILLIAFTYTNYYRLMPLLYNNRRYLLYFIAIACCLWIVILLPVNLVGKPNRPPRERSGPPPHFRQDPPPPRELPPGDMPFLFGRNYNLLLFALSILVSINIHHRKQLHEIERKKLYTELQFLRAQINPHFLFNTLNSIYSLIIAKDDKAADAIVQLSELMRFTMKDANENETDLEKEISYIRNYIWLQEARLGNTVKVGAIIEGDFKHKKIAPLLLVTFRENAFKPGVNPNERSEIIINISATEQQLKLHVKNKQVSSVNTEGGIGLQNIRERLQLQYPGKHTLKIDDNEESYIVDLMIHLI